MKLFKKFNKYFTLQYLEKFVLYGLFAYSLILGIIIAFMYLSLTNLHGIKQLENYKPSIPTKIYDIKGRLISEYFEESREIVELNTLPDYFKKALISVEDKSFYSHQGINFFGIFRAFLVNIGSGYIKEGGSTLTQQLAKILFTSRKRTYFRKVKEIWLALQIEKLYSKEEILEFYINEMYFGHGAYGIESASRLYFNKHAQQLTLTECALLAGLPAAPNKYSPYKNPRASMERHWKVFKNMIADGLISKKEAENAFYDFWINYKKKIISPNVSLWKKRVDNAPYFTEYIRQKIEEEFGKTKLYTEGLKIYTTIDLDLQKIAQESLARKLEEQNKLFFEEIVKAREYFDKNFTDTIALLGLIINNNRINSIGNSKENNRFNYNFKNEMQDQADLVSLIFGFDSVHKFVDEYREKTEKKLLKNKVEGALIAIEPQTGYIKAMVGGSGFSSENQLNRAVQSKRQPGSSFKPFVYAAALDSGLYTPASTFIDEPILYVDRKGEEWIPNNYGGEYNGLVTLRKALQKSINIISVKLADALGLEAVRPLAAKMLHIYDYAEQEKSLPNNLSLALGTASVTPLQMANAFAIIANKGRDVIPISILYIKDRNNNLIKNYEKELNRKHRAQILTPQISFLLSNMLKSTLRPGGTGWGAALSENFFIPGAAGKTGTTDNWKDTWFVGFMKPMATAVWVGFDDPSFSLGLGQDGGKVAAPIWMDFMKQVALRYFITDFDMPEGISEINICLDSGKLPSSSCKNTGTEYFLKGTEPADICTECKEGYKKYDLDENKIDELLDRQRQEKKDDLLKKRLDRLKDSSERLRLR